MSDRELLELAAKAAGIDVEVSRGRVVLRQCLGADKRIGSIWNPLTDDGDEARLEAALGLDCTWLIESVCVRDSWEHFFSHGGDKQAARRRAGVRAAAAIAQQRGSGEGGA